MSNRVEQLSNELEKLQKQRRSVVEQQAQLIEERDNAALPDDIDKAADALMRMSARVDAAKRIIGDLDTKIASVTVELSAAQTELNRIRAAALDADCARVEANIKHAGVKLEEMLDAYVTNRRERAAVLGEVAHPDNRFGHLANALRQLRIDAALLEAYTPRQHQKSS